MALNFERIRSAADRVASSLGLEIVEIEFQAGGKHRLLRVFLEKNAEERAVLARQALSSQPDAESLPAATEEHAVLAHLIREGISLEQLAWITHEDCERFSRDFSVLLDVEELVAGAEYTLEVSSPGLDRKLTEPSDFERFVGSSVKVRTFVPIAGNRHWQGRLTEVKTGGIVLAIAAGGERGLKKRKAVGETAIEIALDNIEKANLDPRI